MNHDDFETLQIKGARWFSIVDGVDGKAFPNSTNERTIGILPNDCANYHMDWTKLDSSVLSIRAVQGRSGHPEVDVT